MAYKWLTKRWEALFPAIQQAQTAQEVEQICIAEIQAWRERPTMKQESSLRVPMNDSRNEAERRLSGNHLHWTMQYLSFSEEWYIRHNEPSKKKLEERLENQQLLKDPDAIVAKGIELLSSEEWAEIALGLAVCTGRRPGEILKTAIFEEKSDYTVIFTGQLKRRESDIPPYEIPTLCEATIAIDALARLRAKLPTTDLDTTTVTQRYSHFVQEAADKHFTMIMPARHGRDGLYGHLFRAVYPRIAVFWYCPTTIDDRHYMATVQGHTAYFEQETEEARRNYASGAHYSDYKIADALGNIDGRQGLKLGERGVELLEVFKPKPKGKESVAPDGGDDQAKAKGKNHPITVSQDTYNRVVALRTGLGHPTYDKTIVLLLDTYEQQKTAPVEGELTPERLMPQEAAELVRQTLVEGEDFQTFLVSTLLKEVKFRAGLDQRHGSTDFSKLTITKLKGIRDKRATYERIRRAVIAIDRYNGAPGRVIAEQWFINATTIHRIVGGRFNIIGDWLKENEEWVNGLNNKYKLNERANIKVYHVETVVTVPDAPVLEQATTE